MKINNKLKIVVLVISTLLFIQILDNVSSAGLGVAPGQIIMNDRLKGTSYLKSIRLFNSGEEPVTFELNATGDIKTWVKMYLPHNLTTPIDNVSVYGKEEILLRFTIPEDIANGNYNGKVNVKAISAEEISDTTGGTVNIVFPVNISIEVTGTQILTGKVTNINIYDIETKQPLVIEVGFLNTGNVIATPLIEVTINDNSGKFVDRFNYSNTDVDIDSDELIIVEQNITNLDIGNYTAEVKVILDEDVIKQQNLSFSVLPQGTLVPKGEIIDLYYLGEAIIDETIIIKAQYKNTGIIPTVAKFVTEVYRNNELIDTLQNPPETVQQPTIRINETHNFTIYYKLTESGSYNLKAYVMLNENTKTDVQTLSFEIPGDFGDMVTIAIAVVLIILVIVTLIFLINKGKIKTRSKKIKTPKMREKKKPKITPKEVKPKKPRRKIKFTRNPSQKK